MEALAVGTVLVEEREQIDREIRQTVSDYFEAAKAKDVEKLLSFWSDSEDFVIAGDGNVLGGYDKWAAWLVAKMDQIDKWIYWNVDDIHVTILSRNAAAYTMNFDYSFIEQGETREVNGSWTYVFRLFLVLFPPLPPPCNPPYYEY